MTDEKKPKAQAREYVVLEQYLVPSDDLLDWKLLGTFKANSESAAKKQAITNAGQRVFGAIVAIPSRSWRPTTPKVTAETVLKIEGV